MAWALLCLNGFLLLILLLVARWRGPGRKDSSKSRMALLRTVSFSTVDAPPRVVHVDAPQRVGHLCSWPMLLRVWCILLVTGDDDEERRRARDEERRRGRRERPKDERKMFARFWNLTVEG